MKSAAVVDEKVAATMAMVAAQPTVPTAALDCFLLLVVVVFVFVFVFVFSLGVMQMQHYSIDFD